MVTKTAFAVLLTSFAALLGCTVNPVTGRSQLDLMGEAQELEMGKRLYPGAIQQSLGPITDEALQEEVGRVGQSVAAVSHRPGLEYHFTAVNDPEVNAFALPGGKICITRGLVSRLQSEDGMAAVLGHEVGHVTARHAVAAYNRQLLAGAILLGGSVYMEAEDVRNRGLIGLGALVGAQLVMASYSREQERQSDELGMDYAVRAGYSPAGMIETQRVLLDLQKKEPGVVQRLFADHPMSAERQRTAEERVAKLPADVVERPLKVAQFREVSRNVVAARPAWDKAREASALLGDQKKLPEAEAGLAEAVRMAPREGVLRTLHAMALAGLKKQPEAVAEGRQGALLAPDVYLGRIVAGQLLLQPEPAAALLHLDTAERLFPGVAQVSLLRGRALEALGRRPEALTAYKQASERDPNGEIGHEAASRARSLE
ncbi:MAG: M48 family metalloprotease [Acidobacteriia bacterium]|nr:M48 family metalloprotease [Terriglobia bacterium]